MRTDDDLLYYIGANFLGIEISSVFKEEEGMICHEIQFLEIITSFGKISFSFHNIHNGYYGDFALQIEEKIKTE